MLGGFQETLEARDAKIRENWVRTMEARLVREELQKCHKAEGVNHYQVCNELAKKYLSLLEDAKVRLFLAFAISHHRSGMLTLLAGTD